MNNVELLNRFFDAENARDWATYTECLDPMVMCFVHSEQMHVPLAGNKEVTDRAIEVAKNEKVTYICEGVDVSASGNRIVASLRFSDDTRALRIFDFEGEKIKWIHEFTLS